MRYRHSTTESGHPAVAAFSSVSSSRCRPPSARRSPSSSAARSSVRVSPPRRASWLRAAALDDLDAAGPTPVTLRIIRQDGCRQVVERRVVYVRARRRHGACARLHLHASRLPHAYDAETKQILCPCHGGVYDVEGRSSPVRRRRRCAALERGSKTATSWSRSEPMWTAARLARSRTGYRRLLSSRARRAAAAGHRMGVHDRQRVAAPRMPGRHRLGAGDVLRAVAVARVRQPAVHHTECPSGCAARPPFLGRELRRRRGRGPPDARVLLRLLQGAARNDVDHRRW